MRRSEMMKNVLAMIAALVACTCLAGVNADVARDHVRQLAAGTVKDLKSCEAFVEDMNLLTSLEEYKPVYNAYLRVRGLAFGAADDVSSCPDVKELCLRYRFVDLMRKFAAMFGFVGDATRMREVQDEIVGDYARRKKITDRPPELAIATEAFVLSGRTMHGANVDCRPLTVLPAPVEIRDLSGSLTLPVREVTKRLVTFADDKTLPDEGYQLSVTTGGIVVKSSSAAGRFYAVQTLRQLGRTERDDTLTFPCVEIRDFPRFGWRGVMLDESRHFFGKAVVKRLLDLMSQYKMNVFHWHLTDNQGWRFPVLKRPDVARKCSTRKCSGNHMDIWDTFEDCDYGPFFYTEKDVREIVGFAAARHIRIVPEIDVPGHSEAILRQYPELSCGGRGGNVYCIGNPETLRFFDDVFDSVVELFPGDVVHIGCDEVGKDCWKMCPKCQAFMEKHGIVNVDGLQAWVGSYVAERLAKKGRRIAGWDELAFEGDIPKGGIILEWRDEKHGGAEAVKKGHPCVLTPWATSYFIGRQCLKDDPFHYGGPQWYGYSHPQPLEKIYRYDPFEEIPESGRALVLGGQCCGWTETTANEAELQWKMWPRALATAENYWSQGGKRDFEDFKRRVAVQRRRLIEQHINCAPLE